MARDDSAPVTADVPVTEAPATEAAPTEAPTEVPATEAPAEPTGPTQEELDAVWAKYEAALQGALDAKDAQAEIPAEQMDALTAAYGDLSRKQRNSATSELQEKIQDILLGETMDPFTAKALVSIQKALAGAKPKPAATVAKVAVDPTRDHIDRCEAFYFAYQLVPVGEGVDGNWADQFAAEAQELQEHVETVKAYRDAVTAWQAADEATRGDEPKAPEVPAVFFEALRLAQGKGARKAAKVGAKSTTGTPRAAFTGERKDIAQHIKEFFEANSGPAKISAISKFVSSQYNGNASSGAITARFSNGKTIEGYAMVEVDGVKGLNKV